jgi:hypothetical protein
MAGDAFRRFFEMIPAPFGGVIRGGWINGSFLLFFAIATCVFWRIGWDAEASPAWRGKETA